MTPLFPLVEYVEQGGWIMMPLLACSLVMWILILDRVLFFHRLSSRDDLGIDEAIHSIEEGRVARTGKGLCAELVQDYLGGRTGDPDLDRGVLEWKTARARPRLRRHLAAIAALATIAPLLGLLGTVTGMVETFDVIAMFGTGNARAMAGGISIALVTTQTGLVIAVPGFLLSLILQRRARRLEQRLQEITTALDRHVGAMAARGPAPC